MMILRSFTSSFAFVFLLLAVALQFRSRPQFSAIALDGVVYSTTQDLMFISRWKTKKKKVPRTGPWRLQCSHCSCVATHKWEFPRSHPQRAVPSLKAPKKIEWIRKRSGHARLISWQQQQGMYLSLVTDH
jgi:hypothetical protein